MLRLSPVVVGIFGPGLAVQMICTVPMLHSINLIGPWVLAHLARHHSESLLASSRSVEFRQHLHSACQQILEAPCHSRQGKPVINALRTASGQQHLSRWLSQLWPGELFYICWRLLFSQPNPDVQDINLLHAQLSAQSLAVHEYFLAVDIPHQFCRIQGCDEKEPSAISWHPFCAYTDRPR